MKELASGTTARDLIPGVPEDIERLANRLIEYSEAAMTAVARLRSMDHGLWIGEAAESFSAQVDQLPAKLSRAAGAFHDAAVALRSYAAVLREAQWTAGRAVELFEEATHCADHDPHGSLEAEAQRLLETARGNVEAAARRAASVLEDAGDAAPDRPGFLHRALHFAGEIAGGAVEATAGMATFAFKLTPAYQLIDPEGYVENLTGLGKGLVFGVTHPVSFAKAVVDWDTWAESPGRAIGHLLPTIALAAATAGAGSAGKGATAADALEGAGVRQTAAAVQSAASSEVGATAGAVARSTARAVVDSDKFRYLFGEVESNAHNTARSAQNLAHMERLGLRGSEGRSLLQAHLDGVVRDPTTIAREFSNQYGTFQIRESLFAGPSGAFAKFETTWQVMSDGSLRLTTLIPFGGR